MSLEALKGYPKEGPAMPERQKIYREKDRHEPGTGRRDREKREGKGLSNWGDPIEDQLAAEREEVVEVGQEPVVEEQPKKVEAAGKFFDNGLPPHWILEEQPKKVEAAGKFFDNEEEDEPAKAKAVVKVPKRFAGMVKTDDNVVVIESE